TVDGMLFAAVLRRPSRGAKLASVYASIAERMPGVVSVVQEDDLVAVLADTDEHAARAVDLLQAQWEETAPHASAIDLPEILVSSGRDPFVTQEAGSLDEAFRNTAGQLEATYFVPYVSNAPMEPRAAVAMWEGDRLTVWAGTQRPFGVRSELATSFKIPEDRVRVIVPDTGSGYGGKHQGDAAHEAARLARVAGKPVKRNWTREE